MQIRPLGNRVLVKTDESADRTAGGLYLPDEAKRKPQRGKVVACGPGELRKTDPGTGLEAALRGAYWPMHVKEGDEVLFARYAGADVGDLEELKGHVLLSEQDIVGIISKK